MTEKRTSHRNHCRLLLVFSKRGAPSFSLRKWTLQESRTVRYGYGRGAKRAAWGGATMPRGQRKPAESILLGHLRKADIPRSCAAGAIARARPRKRASAGAREDCRQRAEGAGLARPRQQQGAAWRQRWGNNRNERRVAVPTRTHHTGDWPQAPAPVPHPLKRLPFWHAGPSP